MVLRRASAWGCEPRWMWIYPWIINFDGVRAPSVRRPGLQSRAHLVVRLGSLEGLQSVVLNRVIAHQSAAAYH